MIDEEDEDEVAQNQQTSKKDLLDKTRIHPENYAIAKKIAKDALDFESIPGGSDSSEKVIEKILKNP